MEAEPAYCIETDEQPLDVDACQAAPLVACACITGALQLHAYTAGDAWSCELKVEVEGPEGGEDEGVSCRAVRFAPDGAVVAAGYGDASVVLYDVQTGSKMATLGDGHAEPISRLLFPGSQLLASGDEGGVIRLWDTRQKKAIYKHSKHTDYISDFTLHAKENALVSVSGDATLSVIDLNKRCHVARSEDDNDDELLSAAVLKGGRKLLAGSQSGVINLFSWGHFKDCSDRFPGHPESVSALVAYDDDTVLTGSSDGAVRILNVLPNKLLGVVGSHEGFPVERLALSADKRVLVSSSHDAVVRLWDLSFLSEDDDGEDADDDDNDSDGEGVAASGSGSDDGAMAAAAAGDASDSNEGSDRDADGQSQQSDDDEAEEGKSGSEDGSDDGASGSGSDGGSEEWETDSEGGSGSGSEQREEEQPPAASKPGRPASAKPGGAKAAAGKGPSSAAPAAAPSDQVGGKRKPTLKELRAQTALAMAGGDGDGSCDDSDADSDDSDGGGRRKKQKREKTKWTKAQARLKAEKKGNFFSDLL